MHKGISGYANNTTINNPVCTSGPFMPTTLLLLDGAGIAVPIKHIPYFILPVVCRHISRLLYGRHTLSFNALYDDPVLLT
jgi:hypothetical protein